MKKKVIFYVDGFNFYRGLKEAKWRRYYWLYIVKLCKSLVRKYKDFEVIEVNYFTARPIFDNGQIIRQRLFLKANQKTNPSIFKVHLGEYKNKKVFCLATCRNEYTVPVEKRTDVNIATQILSDHFTNKSDVIVLISGDNDLVPPIKAIKELNPNKYILIFYPPLRHSSELYKYAKNATKLFDCVQLFNEAKFPNKLDFLDGSSFEIPDKWKK